MCSTAVQAASGQVYRVDGARRAVWYAKYRLPQGSPQLKRPGYDGCSDVLIEGVRYVTSWTAGDRGPQRSGNSSMTTKPIAW